jgi:hypothetical protein
VDLASALKFGHRQIQIALRIVPFQMLAEEFESTRAMNSMGAIEELDPSSFWNA